MMGLNPAQQLSVFDLLVLAYPQIKTTESAYPLIITLSHCVPLNQNFMQVGLFFLVFIFLILHTLFEVLASNLEDSIFYQK